MAHGSCVKDADVLNLQNSTVSENVGNTTFAFAIPNEVDSTKSITSETVEDSGTHNQGIANEYVVNNVDLYLFDSCSKILVDVVSLSEINLTSDTSSDLIVRYDSEKFKVNAGSYNVFAVASSSSVYNITTQDQFIEYEDAKYANNSLMNLITSVGLIMTNRGSSNPGVTTSTSEDRVIEILLERVVAKTKIADYEI